MSKTIDWVIKQRIVKNANISKDSITIWIIFVNGVEMDIVFEE